MRTPIAWLAIGSIALLTACSGDGPEWSELEAQEEEYAGEVLYRTDVVRVVRSMRAEGTPCTQITVDDRPMACERFGIEGFAWSGGPIRVDDHRVILLRTGVEAREFVVWSSVSPLGRSIEPVVAADHALLVWEMQPDEEPWGVQAIGPDGELGIAQSYVGLPGD